MNALASWGNKDFLCLKKKKKKERKKGGKMYYVNNWEKLKEIYSFHISIRWLYINSKY